MIKAITPQEAITALTDAIAVAYKINQSPGLQNVDASIILAMIDVRAFLIDALKPVGNGAELNGLSLWRRIADLESRLRIETSKVDAAISSLRDDVNARDALIGTKMCLHCMTTEHTTVWHDAQAAIPLGRRAMWCREWSYGHRGEPHGAWVRERLGEVRKQESGARAPSGLTFIPDGHDGVRMSDGYQVGWWAFETEDEARMRAATDNANKTIVPMLIAERRLAEAREALVSEIAKSLRVDRLDTRVD